MARGYRSDDRTRCARCAAALPSDELFITTEGELICPACRVAHAGDDLERVHERQVKGLRREHRLLCPRCRAATMVTHARIWRLHSDCTKCGLSTRRLHGGSFFVFAFGLIFTFLGSAIVGGRAPYVTLAWFGWLALGVAFDIGSRFRYRRATAEEIDAADDAAREARIVAATGAATGGPRVVLGSDHDADAALTSEVAAEVEADAAAEPGVHGASSRS